MSLLNELEIINFSDTNRIHSYKVYLRAYNKIFFKSTKGAKAKIKQDFIDENFPFFFLILPICNNFILFIKGDQFA